MYRKFRDDPSSVDPSWHEFLVDYNPEPTTEAAPSTGDGHAAAPQATKATAAQPPAAAPWCLPSWSATTAGAPSAN